tara:strand:+ start:244 stop:699 length:456 start_codon:yes stop_codon:yes gene_type:complete
MTSEIIHLVTDEASEIFTDMFENLKPIKTVAEDSKVPYYSYGSSGMDPVPVMEPVPLPTKDLHEVISDLKTVISNIPNTIKQQFISLIDKLQTFTTYVKNFANNLYIEFMEYVTRFYQWLIGAKRTEEEILIEITHMEEIIIDIENIENGY